MKKINNKKKIIFYTRVLTILLMLLFLSGALVLLLKLISSYLLLSLIFGVSFIIFYIFIKMKTFEYEKSIQFISIKQSYFLKLNRLIDPIEFPNSIFIDFDIQRGLFTTYLMLIIKSKEHKTKKIYCKITGLDQGQIIELKKTLQNAKQYGEN